MIAMMHDAYDDFIQHDAEQEEWLQSRPMCDCCGERIQDESYTEIMGFKLCDMCIEEHTKFID